VADLREQLQDALADRYRLDRELGRGGMATVYLALDLKHDRHVALKVLHPELATLLGPERFQREIRIAARLQHPHILSVHDSGEAAGRLWFTMPYVQGQSLRERLRREQQLSVEEAVRIAREAALALEHAHQEGVLHRDIKPENILLTRDGSTLVADFGIARALNPTGDQSLTQTGLTVGTPAYMSPEQAAGERQLDARSDVYALGAVLYEMLAGEPPYTGPTAQAIIAKRFSDPVPSVRRVRPGVSDALNRAVQRALAMTPADRFATAADFARAIGAAEHTAPSVETVATAVSPRRARHSLTAVLLIGIAIGLGLLFAWRRSHPDAASTGNEPKRVAVLPFENLGDPADAYFADGLTDAVRGKLASVPGLQVIASTSANQYRGTAKSPTEIARELGVGYLLVGRVRWDKRSGASRVEVSPELIEVGQAGAPTTRWQQPFDAALTDVFRVQSDIATRVSTSLDVALGAGTRAQLSARPTANLAAYDEFLKGQDISRRGEATGAGRRAAEHYRRAVTLDPTFASAWAQLARERSNSYASAFPDSAYAREAGEAAARAVALAPNSAESYVALAAYHGGVTLDKGRALEAGLKAVRLAPTDPSALSALALVEQDVGRWEEGLSLLERAQALDPRSPDMAQRLGRSLLWMRRYPEALAHYQQAAAQVPTDLGIIQNMAMVHLAMGDLAGARALLKEPPPGVSQEASLAFIATYWDLGWVLSDVQQRQLLTLGPGPFDGSRANWGLALAQVAALRGDRRRARAFADSARLALAEQVAESPTEPQSHALLAVALAYLGRRSEAIREGVRGRDLLPISRDATGGPYQQHQLVRVYLLVGEFEKAIDELEPLLKTPYLLSPGWLKVDPTFAPLRGNPRFERLVNGS
jgi:serine/threonine-protein kinase